LSPEALLEASALVTEAKALVMIEEGVRSRRSGLAATGTGTDCVVVAAPRSGATSKYAGKHTAVGAAIGASVDDALRRGVRAWLAEQAERGAR
jgi:adenosylcobinamide amidohydrolase